MEAKNLTAEIGENVPPGQRSEPGPEVTLQDATLELISAALAGAMHIAIYPPKTRILKAAQATMDAMEREAKEQVSGAYGD